MRFLTGKALQEKEVRRLQKKLWSLYIARRKLGYIALDNPIRNGWYMHLALRDDVARRKDAYVFQEIINSCSKWVWGRDKKHVNKQWKKEINTDKELQWPGFKKIKRTNTMLLP